MPNTHHPTMESMYKVYLGVHDKTTAVESVGGQKQQADPWSSQMSRVSRIRIHPSFDASNKLNDLAMIVLADEIEMGENVRNACLPPSTLSDGRFDEATMREGWIVGWGSLFEGGPMANWLRNSRVDVYDGKECENVVREYRKNWSKQICAGIDEFLFETNSRKKICLFFCIF